MSLATCGASRDNQAIMQLGSCRHHLLWFRPSTRPWKTMLAMAFPGPTRS